MIQPGSQDRATEESSEVKRSVSGFGVAVVAIALLAGAHASAQTEPWSQEKATALAGELEQAVAGLRDSIRKSPSWEIPGQRKALSRIMRKLRSIESESLSLHAKLAKGATMEDTRLSYERIQSLRRDAQVEAKKVDVSAFTQPKLDRATEVLNRLAPMYPAEPAPTKPEEEGKS
jgi:hypothetical protein